MKIAGPDTSPEKVWEGRDRAWQEELRERTFVPKNIAEGSWRVMPSFAIRFSLAGVLLFSFEAQRVWCPGIGQGSEDCLGARHFCPQRRGNSATDSVRGPKATNWCELLSSWRPET
jgi:hypothetical protein